MSAEPEVLKVLNEIRDLLKQKHESKSDMTAFFKKQMEESTTRGNELLELQKSAVKRQKIIQKTAIPLLFLCIVFISYLILKA